MPALQHYRENAEQQMPHMQDLSDFLHANKNWKGTSFSMITLFTEINSIV
jgi:hypothetical protein